MTSLERLGDLIEITQGYPFESTAFGDAGDMPVIRIRDVLRGRSTTFLRGHCEPQYIINDGDILIGMDGEFNRARWKGGKAALNQRVCRISAKNGHLDEGFLFYFLPAELKRIEAQTSFATVKHLSAKQIREIAIPLPPLPEQRRIAAILDQADALRTKRRAALGQLDEMAQAIFVEMFGDPIENPRRFPSMRLGTLVDESRGISYGIVQRGPDRDTGVAVLRISDIAGGKVNQTKLKITTPEIAGRFRRTCLVGGELVISIRGTVGLVAAVPSSLAGANVSREIAVIPLKRGVSRTFVRDLIRTDGAQRHIVADVKGVAQSGINLEDLRELPVIQPPVHLLTEYERRIAEYEKIEMKASISMDSLDTLFASLQHRAFRGEL